MISENSNPQIFKVKRPDGKIYEVPEANLDKAIELGGEVLEDNPPIQPPEFIALEAPAPQKMFKVKRPDGKIYEVPEANLNKARELGGQIMEDASQGQYVAEHPVAAFAKNVGASAVGAIPDLGVGIANLTTHSGRPSHDPVTGEEFPAHEPLPYVTDMISNSIDKATSGYTKDTGAISKHAARFLGSLFGTGFAGKAIQGLGASGKLGKASEATEKTGSFIANNLGISTPSVGNVSGTLAAGGATGFSEENDLPVYLQLPLAIGSFILGQGIGNKSSNALKPLFDKVPGLQKVVNSGHYEDLAKHIKPEAISDLLKTSLIEKETDFLTKKTLSELPEDIRLKIEKNSALLTEDEINLVVDKGMQDFVNKIETLEKEYFPLTTGEYTGSPKIIAKEDALANKPNIDNFDIALKERKEKITKRLEKIKDDLSSEAATSEELGAKTAKEVQKVYSDAYKMRSQNWNRNFGEIVDENILPISDFQNKLKEFSKLRPDTEGNRVAIKAATRMLKDGIQYEQKISPRRFNDILVGLNEEIRRFPDKTFSQKQMMELKAALEADLTKSIEAPSTQGQASIIRKARAAYAEDSKIIDQIDESVLFSKINKGSLEIPEKIAQSLNNMPTSQLRLTFDALKRSPTYHEIIPKIQRYYIDTALEAATKGGAENFNPRIFLDKLPKKQEFEVIFDGTNAYQEIKDIAILLKRMQKFQPSRSNSKSAQRLQADRGDLEEVAEAATSAVKGDWMASIKKLLKVGNGNAYDRKISELLISPEHRKNILKSGGKSKNNIKMAIGIQSAAEQKEK